MKNKIFNELGFIIIFYAVSLGLVLLIGQLNWYDPLVIFLVLPLPFFVAIYLGFYVKKAKHFYKVSFKVYRDTLDEKDKQIDQLNTMDKVRIDRIKLLEKQLGAVEVPVKPARPGTPLISYVCPECNEPMTRQTDKIAFCDNPSCNRKQFKKDTLE